MSEPIEGISSLEELRAAQAAQCEPMSIFECKSFWNGFPPEACMVNPQDTVNKMTSDPDFETPLQTAAKVLEDMCGPRALGLNRDKFNQSAQAPETNSIASLSFIPKGYTT